MTIYINRNPTAVNVGIGRKVTQIAFGSLHTCALLDDGYFKCWGYNWYGQLGTNSTSNSYIQTTVNIGIGRNATQIAAVGRYHTCAMLDDGTLKCWGNNWFGQLGTNDTRNWLMIQQQILEQVDTCLK